MKRWRHYTKETAIVVAGFGSVKSLAHYQNFHRQVAAEFNEQDVFLSFSSRTILKKLARKEIFIKNLPQTLADLDREGYKKVVVVSLNLFPTDEEKELQQIVEGFSAFTPQKILLTPALFSRTKIFSQFLFDLHSAFRREHPNANLLYLAHGSPYLQQAGAYALEYARNFLKTLDDNCDFFTIEGVYPFSLCQESYKKKLQLASQKEIVLVSLLLVSGAHFDEDIIDLKEELEKDFSVSMASTLKEDSNFYLLGNPDLQKIISTEIKNALRKIC